MRRYLLGLSLGLLFALPAMSAPAAAAEPSALLSSSVGYHAEKATFTVQITSTAEQASHATASASAERCSTGISVIALDLATPTYPVALEVGHPTGTAYPNNDGFVIRDPGDDDEDNAARRPGLIAHLPGDNEASGDGDIELPQAA